MLKIRLLAPTLATLLVLSASRSGAVTITEDFSSNPQSNGWQIFGDTNFFRWNSTNRDLIVTWDSSQSNSYFHHPLGTILDRYDDFSIAFDLHLDDITSGTEPGKTGPMQLGFGFLNFARATSTNFMRGSFGNAPDVAEFDYYTDGYYDYFGTIYPAPATTVPSFISGVNSYDYCPSYLTPYDNVLPTNQTVHVVFAYAASNQTAAITLTTTNGLLGSLPGLVLTSANGFLDSDNFHVDMISISSYSSSGDDYDSVLAHGSLANITVTLPPLVRHMTGSISNNVWLTSFTGYTNWNYVLERTKDFQTWTNVSPITTGVAGVLTLLDTNPPPERAFYRVRAEQP